VLLQDSTTAAGRKLLASGKGQTLWVHNVYMRHSAGGAQALSQPASAGNKPSPPQLVKVGNGAEVYMTSTTAQGTGSPDAAALSIGAADTGDPARPGRATMSGARDRDATGHTVLPHMGCRIARRHQYGSIAEPSC
jgi:hypothetical protein